MKKQYNTKMVKQLSPEAKKSLEEQQYRFVGSHSAVKVCHWTKNSIRNKGFCYKHSFYGINSHQCLQSTPSISCANRCIFCWRGYKAPVSKKWNWEYDNPKEIIDGMLKQHVKLLQGFGGSPSSNKKIFKEAHSIKHAALSLTGEALIYPNINELLELFNKRGISTFIVTNG